MELLLIRQVAVLVASAIGAYTDFRTGYIYDWITIPLILFGLVLNVVEQQYIAIALGAAVFVIGYLLYYTGKLGGGDVKLYAGIALSLPFYNGVFILSATLLAALSAVIFFSTYYTIKYFRKGIDLKYNSLGIRRAGVLFALVALYLFILWNGKIVSQSYILLVGIPLIFGVIFVALEKGIRKEFFLKKIKIGELEDDEIIAIDFMDEKTKNKISSGFKGVIGEKEKGQLEKEGLKEIFVYRNLPRFGPFIFIGVLLAIFVPSFSGIIMGL